MVHFLCREKDYKMGNEEANMVSILLSVLGQRGVDALAFLLAFVLTALLTNLFRGRLPQDHGRAFAVDGALSKGKARGAGLIFVLCVVLVALAFMPFHLETVIYMVLLIASMLSGYLDDASAEFDALEKKLQHNLDRDLDHFAKEIKDMLAVEIIKRYYYQRGSIIQQLKDDPDLKEAVKILGDPVAYQKMLSAPAADEQRTDSL